MKKLDKHIQKSHFVKVYLGDSEGNHLKHFEGVVFSYNNDFVFMCDFADFNPDGFVVFRKDDIIDVQRTENETFFDHILKSESLLRTVRVQKREFPLRLSKMETMFAQLREFKLPIIIECLYTEEELFHLGIVKKMDTKKVEIQFLGANGIFEKENRNIDFDDITFFRFDSPYANLFYKYALENDASYLSNGMVQSDDEEEEETESSVAIEQEEDEESGSEPVIVKKVKKHKVTKKTVEISEQKKPKKDKKDKKKDKKKSKKDKKSRKKEEKKEKKKLRKEKSKKKDKKSKKRK